MLSRAFNSNNSHFISATHFALWSRATADLFLGGAKMFCCLLGFALHCSQQVWETQMRGPTILCHLISVVATHSGSTSGAGSPWNSMASSSVHKHVRLSPLAESGADLREPREMWHPAAAWFLSLLSIVCRCSLRLSHLSQKRNDPGSRCHFFIRTDAFGNNFGNVLGRILSSFHTQKQILCRILSLSCTQKQIFLSHLSFSSISSLLYPPPILCFFSLPQTKNRCLKSKGVLSGCTVWMDFKYMDLDTPLFLSILSVKSSWALLPVRSKF